MPFRQRMKRSKLLKAQSMRDYPTKSEQVFWEAVRGKSLGIRFRRQEPILGWIADFYCAKGHLAIEIDGSSHDNQEAQYQDSVRDVVMQEHGLMVLRYSNDEVEQRLPEILAEIVHCVLNRATKRSKFKVAQAVAEAQRISGLQREGPPRSPGYTGPQQGIGVNGRPPSTQ